MLLPLDFRRWARCRSAAPAATAPPAPTARRPAKASAPAFPFSLDSVPGSRHAVLLIESTRQALVPYRDYRMLCSVLSSRVRPFFRTSITACCYADRVEERPLFRTRMTTCYAVALIESRQAPCFVPG